MDGCEDGTVKVTVKVTVPSGKAHLVTRGYSSMFTIDEIPDHTT